MRTLATPSGASATPSSPPNYQHYLLESLNGVGFMDADGMGASCLTDGSMSQFLTDWYNWTEEGWCEIPALSSASSSVETDTLKDFWAAPANEGYKISYEQVKDASAPAMFLYTSKWNSVVRTAYSDLIQGRDITPDQALESLVKEAEAIFPAK